MAIKIKFKNILKLEEHSAWSRQCAAVMTACVGGRFSPVSTFPSLGSGVPGVRPCCRTATFPKLVPFQCYSAVR